MAGDKPRLGIRQAFQACQAAHFLARCEPFLPPHPHALSALSPLQVWFTWEPEHPWALSKQNGELLCWGAVLVSGRKTRVW